MELASVFTSPFVGLAHARFTLDKFNEFLCYYSDKLQRFFGVTDEWLPAIFCGENLQTFSCRRVV